MANNGGQVAVSASSLSKSYRLGESQSLLRTATRLLGRGNGARAELDVLTNVDFTVHRGDAIGLVGANGSGKSTLLQILAGTTLPSSGSMYVQGRVLPLLAVGVVFHPELTGRENVALFAASLNFPQRTVTSKMDAVAEFAELERHMDTPVKRFSSGMVSRLSFAIAVQFPADIYIFDEVLAVVDHDFQERCIAEIKKLHASGKTIFFVSHSRDQVTSICDQVMWLHGGTVREIGPAAATLDAYEEVHASP
jgi:ABC-type polysaccharide/polyol phosphate transport system ATPase subunit